MYVVKLGISMARSEKKIFSTASNDDTIGESGTIDSDVNMNQYVFGLQTNQT